MVKKSNIRFVQLKEFLEGMGFTATRGKAGWRFEHEPSGTIFHFRPYRVTDRVYYIHLFVVRSQLDARGMLSERAFDESLTDAFAYPSRGPN